MLYFYNSQGQLVKSIEPELFVGEGVYFSIGFNGSLTGSFVLEVTDIDKPFFESVTNLSHFFQFRSSASSPLYGGVVLRCTIDDNIATIEFGGALEYFENVFVTPYHLASNSKLVFDKDDPATIITLYADSSAGILFSLLYEVKETIKRVGGYSGLFDLSGVVDFLSNSSPTASVTLERSYRVNLLSPTTLRSCIEDFAKETDLQLFVISVNDDLDSFKFMFNFLTSSPVRELDVRVDGLYDVQVESNDVVRRTRSVVVGTDLKGRDTIVREPFANNVIFSEYLDSSNSERSDALSAKAKANVFSLLRTSGTFMFSSFEPSFDVLDFFIITKKDGDVVQGICTEKEFSGNVFTYKLQLGDASAFNASLNSPKNFDRRILFDRINTLERATEKRAQGSLPTGFRT